jgi:hypothetical protein
VWLAADGGPWEALMRDGFRSLFWQQLTERTVRLARRRQRQFSDEVDGCPLKRMT